MPLNYGNKSVCPCNTECKDCVPGFKKIIDLKNAGLVIYRHTTHTEDVDTKTGNVQHAVDTTEDVYILHNTTDKDVSSADYWPEIEKNTIKCPRCRTIKENARKLLQKGPTISGNDVKGICDHCKMKDASCSGCQEVVKSFIPSKPERTDVGKERVKHWLGKIKLLLDDTSKDKKLAHSNIHTDQLYRNLKSPVREPDVVQLFGPHKLDSASSIRPSKDKKKVAKFPQLEKLEQPILFKDPLKRGVMSSFANDDLDFSEISKTMPHAQPETVKHKIIKYTTSPEDREVVAQEEPLPDFEKIFEDAIPLTGTKRNNYGDITQSSITAKDGIEKKFIKSDKQSPRDIYGRPVKLPYDNDQWLNENNLKKANLYTKVIDSKDDRHRKYNSTETLVTKVKDVTLGHLRANDIIFPQRPHNNFIPKQKSSSELIKQTAHKLLANAKDEKSAVKDHKQAKQQSHKIFSKTKIPGERTDTDNIKKHSSSAARKGQKAPELAEKTQKDGQKAASTAENNQKDGQKAASTAEKNAQKAASTAEKNQKDAQKAALIAEKNSKIAEKNAHKAALLAEKNFKIAEKNAQKAALTAEKNFKTAEKDSQQAKKDARNAAQKNSPKAETNAQKAAQKTAEKDAQQAKKAASKAEEDARLKRAEENFRRAENAALQDELNAQKAERSAEKAANKALKDSSKDAQQAEILSPRDKMKKGSFDNLSERAKKEPKKHSNMMKNANLYTTNKNKIKASLSEKRIRTEDETAEERRRALDKLISNLAELKLLAHQGIHHTSPDLRMAQNYIEIHCEQHTHQKNEQCLLCANSDIALEFASLCPDNEIKEELSDIIVGEQILKFRPPRSQIDDFSEEKESEMHKDIPPDHSASIPRTGTGTGYWRYSLSDRKFIDNGWTQLPTEKVVRKMNVYRMRPSRPEFDWFEHNRDKRLMQYDTGEKLAEFDDNGRGRWFYRNGRMALAYYDAEEQHAGQRFVVYSNGEPDERGRSRRYTLLATFDYLGNGIVFDHSGKIRLKYNQTEGVVLDRSIGPVSHWKWHTLNDPPVLQQVMLDTEIPHKDPEIMKMGKPGEDKPKKDDEEMLAIEFDNIVKEKSKKLSQTFRPFQIRMKALKINEHFSLRVLDQATVYLLYRDGTTNLKLNIGMVLDNKEIVDTVTADVGDVSNNLEKLPARTESLAALQKSIAKAQQYDRMRTERERKLYPRDVNASVDKLVAGISRPIPHQLLTTEPSGSLMIATADNCKCNRKPTATNMYYDTRF